MAQLVVIIGAHFYRSTTHSLCFHYCSLFDECMTPGAPQLTVDPFPNSEGEDAVGNATMFINDSRGLRGVRANCFFVEVLRGGCWLHCFVVTSDLIEEGEELLLDYGKEYWKTMDPLIELIGLPVHSAPLETADADADCRDNLFGRSLDGC